MMTVGMQGSEPAGFGAPRVNTARPATTQSSQSDRRVSKDRSFDDHLDDSLSEPIDDEDSAAGGDAAAMPIASQPEAREPVARTGGGAAQEPIAPATETLPASNVGLATQPANAAGGETSEAESTIGEAAQDVSLHGLTSVSQATVAETAANQVGQTIEAQTATAARQDVKSPSHGQAQVHADERLGNLLNPVEAGTDPETEATPAVSKETPGDVDTRTTSQPRTFGRNQFDTSDERRVGPPVSSGGKGGEIPPDAARPSASAENPAGNAEPAAIEAHLRSAPEPSASMEVVARPVAAAASMQFHAIVGSDAEAAAPAEAPRGPLLPETADSIIQSLRMQYQRGGGDAVVHIKPEHLGPVTVSLRVENGVVSAVVNADNPAVAEWLKANEHVLREGLASSGLHLERFAVRRDGQPSDDSRKGWRPPERSERRRRLLQPESTFEITV